MDNNMGIKLNNKIRKVILKGILMVILILIDIIAGRLFSLMAKIVGMEWNNMLFNSFNVKNYEFNKKLINYFLKIIN